MLEGTEAITGASLVWALDAATLRHQAIAKNIANANADNYVPVKVNFEAHVRDGQRELQDRGRLSAGTVASLFATPLPTAAVLDAAGAPAKVQVDSEVANMAQNSVHYQALIKGLSRHLGILATAVSDGKR